MSVKELGIGIIGIGRWGKQHVVALRQTEGARLVAVAARSPETSAAAQAEFGVPSYTDYQDLLARADVEAVTVVAPNYLHYALTMAALQAGKHVLVEKPMAFTSTECEQMIAAAHQAERVLYVGHEFRQFAIWRKVKELLAAGAIGQPLFGDIQLWRYPYRSGSGGWKQDMAKVGNWLLEEPIHYFDLACWFMEGSKPHSLYARASSRSPEKAQFFENFTALLDFQDGSYVNITRVVTAYNFEIGMRFTGTDGVLRASWEADVDISLQPRASIKLYSQADKTEREIAVTQQTGHAFELANQTAAFVAAVRGGQPPAVSGEAGRRAVQLCEAAFASLTEDKVIKF